MGSIRAATNVGEYTDAGGKSHGFLLSGGGLAAIIDFPGAIGTIVSGINPIGDIVGTYTDTNSGLYPWATSHGFLLSRGEFASIDFPGAVLTAAWRINPTGQIVGRYESADSKFHVYSLGNGSFTSIDVPGAIQTAPAVFGTIVGINPSGDVVGVYCTALSCATDTVGHFHGFLLSGGGFSRIDFPGAIVTGAYEITPSGDIAGSYQDTNLKFHGYLRKVEP